MFKPFLLLLAFALLLPVLSPSSVESKEIRSKRNVTVQKQSAIWLQPSDIRTRNLFFGPGGRAGLPHPPFRFIEEDKQGGSPKFVVRDGRGLRWKVKVGREARPETAAVRLLWAVGYFADTNYYLQRTRVLGLPKLSRGAEFTSPDGTVRGARFERMTDKIDDWSWFDNPFVGTREFDGLRVMMSLMNKWDLKQSNNGILNAGRRQRYYVSDLGDTFGRTGGDGTRTKGDVQDYMESTFIDRVNGSEVDLVMKSRPPIYYAVAVPYYVKRTRMEKVADDIPRSHARWIGHWLGQLSNRQIRDAFRAAGYSPAEVEGFASEVRQRITQLNRL